MISGIQSSQSAPDGDAPGRPLVVACLVIVAIVLLLESGGAPVRDALRLEGNAPGSGQAWRWLSGHLVHLGWSHALMNLAALVLIAWVFGSRFRAAHWLIITLGSVLAVDVGLLLVGPGVDWYVGLSGVLHGLVVAGAAAMFAGKERATAALILVAVALKLAWEIVIGPLPHAAELAGGPVLVEAHLWGALGGGACGLILIRARRLPV